MELLFTPLVTKFRSTGTFEIHLPVFSIPSDSILPVFNEVFQLDKWVYRCSALMLNDFLEDWPHLYSGGFKMPVIKEEPIDCDLSVSDCLAPSAALVGDDIVPGFDIKKERDWVDDPSTLTLVSHCKGRQCLSSALSDHEVAYMKKCVVLVERLQVSAAGLAQLRLPVVIKEERIDLDYEIFQDNMVIKEEPGLKQEDLLDGNLSKGELEMKDDQIISEVSSGGSLFVKPRRKKIERLVKCQLCNFLACTANGIKRHMPVHSEDKKYPCPECHYRYADKSSLNIHILSIHRKEKPYVCPYCDHRTSQRSNLRTHIRGVHKTERLYKCFHCGYSANLKNTLKFHIISVHIGVKNYSYKSVKSVCSDTLEVSAYKFECVECDEIASQSGIMRSKVNCVHIIDRPYKCQLCYFNASRRYDLQMHIDNAHLGRKYKCPECMYSSVHKSAMNCHVRAVHRKEKPYKCPHCDHRTAQPGHLGVHIRTVHFKIKPLKCEECSYRTDTAQRLNQHIDSVHKKLRPYRCPECTYRASRFQIIKTHLAAFHRKEKPYKCPYCTSSFSYTGSLSSHITSKHIQNKPFQCGYCSFRSNRRDSIQKHMQFKHTKEKPFCCSYCDYRACLKKSLSNHIMSKHTGEKPFQCHYCNHRTVCRQNMNSHIAYKHTGSTVPYRCHSCKYNTPRKSHLLRHISSRHP